MDKIFFQDFLFKDMPVDEHENPVVTLAEYPNGLQQENMEVSFDLLLRMNKQSEWEDFFEEAMDKVVVIKDDVSVANKEMTKHKEFYLKTYFFNISAHAKKCYVRKQN